MKLILACAMAIFSLSLHAQQTAKLDQSDVVRCYTMEADEMARRAFDQLAEGRFMIRPHPQVEDYFKAKAMDYDRWVGGMRKLRRMQIEQTGRPL